MRIISKFKDYYDGVQQHFEQDIVYNRSESEETIELADFFDLNYLKTVEKVYHHVIYESQETNIICNLVGVCGKLYFIFICDNKENNLKILTRDFDEIDQFIEEYMSKNSFHRWMYFAVKKHSESIKEILKIKENDEIFHKLNAPLFLIQFNHEEDFTKKWNKAESRFKVNVQKNPNLSALKFFKFIDTNSMYQEIRQYLSGVLGNKENKKFDLSDKDMLQSKGFFELSFKKRKNDKKRKQKKCK